MEENNTNNQNIETTVNNNINEKSTTNNTPQKDRKGFATTFGWSKSSYEINAKSPDRRRTPTVYGQNKGIGE